MTNPSYETTIPPFVNFRFEIILNIEESLPGVSNPVCNAAFSECSGLEMSMEPKTINELGAHQQQTHRIGAVSYGRLSLRRGMTPNMNLWDWFENAIRPGRKTTASGEVRVMMADGTPAFTIILEECRPVRLSGPSLNARNSDIAIEEMQLVYQRMYMKSQDNLASGLSIGVSANISGSLQGSLKVGGEVRASGGIKIG